MRPTKVAAVATAAALAVGLIGFVAGRSISSPGDAAAKASAPKPSLIGVPVEFKELSANLVVRGSVNAVGATAITLPATQIGQSENIVVRAPERGAAVNEGDVLMVIGDRPVIVLQGDLPMYRDLKPGMRGEDVLLLENALQRLDLNPGDVDGTYDSATSSAVRALYENRELEAIGRSKEDQAKIDELSKQAAAARAAGNTADAGKAESELDGIVASTGPSVPANEVVFVSVLPAKVESIAVKRGSRIDGSIATIATSEAVVQSSIARVDKDLVSVGTEAKVDVTDSGTSFQGKVATIAAEPGTEGAGANRYAITIESADIPPDSLGIGVRITIPVKSTAGKVLAVPAAALSIDGDGDASVNVIDSSGDRSKSVKVKPGLQAKGFVEIEPVGGSVKAGDFVAVGKRDGSGATTTVP